MTKLLFERVDDNAQVRAICERLGCWKEVVRQMEAGMSGVIATNHWVIGFFDDGLIAYRPRTALEAAAAWLSLYAQLTGPIESNFGVSEPAERH